MSHHLTYKDIIALGFMTFALFIGAGNIIFPPIIGLQAGEHLWTSALGFTLTAVGLPVLTVIALARVGGGMDALSCPLGQKAGTLLTTVCYLSVGPLFSTPRTASVSFQVGLAPLVGDAAMPLLIYSIVYFMLVIGISLYPGRLLDTVGHVLAPLKILALAILSISVLLWPASSSIPIINTYQIVYFLNGFVSGYLTMDTLGAMVFGIVIVNAARSRGVHDAMLLTRYTILAGLIAGIGLIVVYLGLFKLGSISGEFIPHAENGAEILQVYVQYTFGRIGTSFLVLLIFITCIVTAVGLTCACADFFSQYLPFSYRTLVFIMGGFSALVANLGLSSLIQLSMPILTAIYPCCIILVLLNFTLHWWNQSSRIVVPTILVGLFFGLIDGIRSSIFASCLPNWSLNLPLGKQGLSWMLPSLVSMLAAVIYDRLIGRQKITAHQ